MTTNPQITLDRFPEAIAMILLKLDKMEELLRQKELIPSTSKPIGTKELCEFLGISEVTCIKYRRKKLIPFYTVGSSIKYDLNKVIEALEKQKRK